MTSERQDFDGKVGIVTGGGSGIGEACVQALAARGASVVVADFDLPNAERVASEALLTDSDS